MYTGRRNLCPCSFAVLSIQQSMRRRSSRTLKCSGLWRSQLASRGGQHSKQRVRGKVVKRGKGLEGKGSLLLQQYLFKVFEFQVQLAKAQANQWSLLIAAIIIRHGKSTNLSCHSFKLFTAAYDREL